MSLDGDELLIKFENGTAVNMSSLTPQPAGSLEYFEYTPMNGTLKNGTVIFFRLVAIDKADLKSEPSNLARATMFIPSPPPPPKPTQKPGNSANGITGTLGIMILTLVSAIAVFHI